MKRLAYTLSVTILLASVSARATETPVGSGKSASPAAASPNISCPGDAVVWVNPRSRAYHLEGDKFFGHTKRGKFECKKAADAEGDHPIPVKK